MDKVESITVLKGRLGEVKTQARCSENSSVRHKMMVGFPHPETEALPARASSGSPIVLKL